MTKLLGRSRPPEERPFYDTASLWLRANRSPNMIRHRFR